MIILRFDPKTKQVKRDQEIFLRLMGECISLWAFLDRELFKLAHAALGTDAKRTAIVFYSWTTLSNHLRFVDRLMKHSLPENQFVGEWRPLQKLILRHLATRSVYAHQPVKRTGTSKGTRPFYFYSIHIEPAELLFRSKHEGLGGKTELVARDLRKHARSLEKLVTQVSKFRINVSRSRS